LLGWEDSMPSFAHLPLILKPDGNGKLSKRAADKAGFPIFPLDWTDTDGNHADGFREAGYLPEAMVNFLAFLGWNPGGEKELYRMNDLVEAFSIERIGKAGTKFDIEKAQWYNQQYIKSSDTNNLAGDFIELLRKKHGISCDPKKAEQIVELLKARVTFGHEFVDQALYFFQEPLVYDEKVLRKKWTKEAANGLSAFAKKLQEEVDIDAERTQILFQDTLQKLEINPGKVMQALRLSLTGEGSGPDLMQIIAIMDGKSASDRINYSLQTLHDQINE
ncbi:MAG: glutamate--tRNA ligase, partial [Cyclobacteriaceae bacterium]|nr:glutamate--tRNA ligase [Cyclobacteriaceae bacterium HetDA_MAG_MS6]